MKSLPKPVGLLAFSDAFGATLCTMCRLAGLSVPEDVAILGLGNHPLNCALAPVELSSVDPAADEYGRQAAALLQPLMRGEPPPSAPVLVSPRGIAVRRSTDVLAVGDPMVAQAMRFLWDLLVQNLSVDDVASAVATTRRKLERTFRRHLKRGANAELRCTRLERCCELLRSTDASIASVVPQVGYRSADFLHVSFKKAFSPYPCGFPWVCDGRECVSGSSYS